MKKIKIKTEEEIKDGFNPSKEETKLYDFIESRVHSMKEYRKNILGKGKNIEDIWREADGEYSLENIDNPKTVLGKHKLFVTDEDKGLRSSLVSLDATKDGWKNHSSDPVLFVKVQTALSVIIDKNPRASFNALTRKNEAKTQIAHALWETSWEIDKSVSQIKLFCLNMMKYGWGIGRTYPRIIKRKKDILVSYDENDTANNKYETREITEFDGIHRENLDPYRTWIDEMTTPYDSLSTNDWAFDKDYDYSAAEAEFGHYPNWKYVKLTEITEDGDDSDRNLTERTNVVTLRFYENKNKDLYAITVPSQKLILHACPLPNDEGRLSLWHAPWYLRNANTPYGIGLWEIIKSDKNLYDKMKNMTMDQLVLSIYKMFFYTGSNVANGDGEIEIEPGKGVQNLGGKVDFLEIPGPGKDSFDGLNYVKSLIDDNSGISPIVQGEITGKTLGEILNAKESALKRMSVPIDNLTYALSNEAYLSLSWMNQVYSVPEVIKFLDLDSLKRYEKDTGISFDAETSLPDGEIGGVVFKELPLKLKKQGDTIVGSKDKAFFKIGKDILDEDLHWEGIIQIIPKSIMTPSVELEKQRKVEIFNIVVPLLAQPPEIFAKPTKQILVVNDEDPEDWLPDSWLMFLAGIQPEEPLFIDPMEQLLGGGTTQPGQSDNSTRNTAKSMQEGQKMSAPELSTVVPRGQVSSPHPEVMGGSKTI